jgi:hypothetical protein
MACITSRRCPAIVAMVMLVFIAIKALCSSSQASFVRCAAAEKTTSSINKKDQNNHRGRDNSSSDSNDRGKDKASIKGGMRSRTNDYTFTEVLPDTGDANSDDTSKPNNKEGGEHEVKMRKSDGNQIHRDDYEREQKCRRTASSTENAKGDTGAGMGYTYDEHDVTTTTTNTNTNVESPEKKEPPKSSEAKDLDHDPIEMYNTGCYEYHYKDHSIYTPSGHARDICQMQFDAQQRRNAFELVAMHSDTSSTSTRFRRYTMSGFSKSSDINDNDKPFMLDDDLFIQLQSVMLHKESGDCRFHKEAHTWGSTTHSNHWSSPTYFLDLNACCGNADTEWIVEALTDQVQDQLYQWLEGDAAASWKGTATLTDNLCHTGDAKTREHTHACPTKSNVKSKEGDRDTVDRTILHQSPLPPPMIYSSPMMFVRLHSSGAVIPFHTTSDPFAFSAIISLGILESENISGRSEDKKKDSESASPWPFQFLMPANVDNTKDHIMMNCSLVPGEILFVEGRSVVHGRTVPLAEGHFYAQLELHFSVLEHPPQLQQEMKSEQGDDSTVANEKESNISARLALRDMYHTVRARKMDDGNHYNHPERSPQNSLKLGYAEMIPHSDDLPYYLSKSTTLESNLWRRQANAHHLWTRVSVDEALRAPAKKPSSSATKKKQPPQEMDMSNKATGTKASAEKKSGANRLNTKSDSSTKPKSESNHPSDGEHVDIHEGDATDAKTNAEEDSSVGTNARAKSFFSSTTSPKIGKDSYMEDVSYVSPRSAATFLVTLFRFSLPLMSRFRFIFTFVFNATTRTIQSEAHKAARKGDLDTLERILTANPEAVNQADSNGYTPLHEAVMGKDTGIIAFLLAHGANINAVNKDGITPLVTAFLEYGVHSTIFTFLKRRGATLIEPLDEVRNISIL